MLSDPTGTYGIRAVGGAILIADATPFVPVTGSTGQYTYTVAGVVAGVTYEYYLEVVYGGETYRQYKTFVGEAVGAGLSPSVMLAELKTVFGGNAAGADDIATILIRCLKHSAAALYEARHWNDRQRDVDVVAAAGIATTALSADFGQPDAADWLADSENEGFRPRYVSPHSWQVELAQLQDSDYLRIYTLNTDPATGLTIVRWGQPAQAAVIFKGLRYWAKAPTCDETSVAAYFWTPILDRIWPLYARRVCRDAGLQPAQGIDVPGWDLIEWHLERAVAQLCSKGQRPKRKRVHRDTDDLNVQVYTQLP
jgi:hypothetical protein